MKAKQIRDWELERYHLQELSPRRMREIDALLDKDPDLRRRLEEFQESDKQILDLYPPHGAASAIERKIEEKRIEIAPIGEKHTFFCMRTHIQGL